MATSGRFLTARAPHNNFGLKLFPHNSLTAEGSGRLKLDQTSGGSDRRSPDYGADSVSPMDKASKVKVKDGQPTIHQLWRNPGKYRTWRIAEHTQR
jgi:hypothetical protein